MHPEALTETGTRLFPELKAFKDFYLVGGTALSLQIGHRVSVDFDMFSDEELPRTLLAKVKRVFSGAVIAPSINNPEQLNITIDGVRATFFWYRYPPVLPLVEHAGVKMAGVKEIAAMKALAIGMRGTYRDYIDMYFLLFEKQVRLEEVCKIADSKYGVEFNQRLFLEQLLYMEDVPEVEVDFLRDEVDKSTIQQFLEEEVGNFKL